MINSNEDEMRMEIILLRREAERKRGDWLREKETLIEALGEEHDRLIRLRVENAELRAALKLANRPPHPDYDADSA